MASLGAMILRSIGQIEVTRGVVSDRYLITIHPMLKKRILREHVKQECAEAGKDIYFASTQSMPQNKVMIQAISDVPIVDPPPGDPIES
jgi:hypothetical protein